MHAAVAEQLRRDPAILERARERVEEQAASGLLHPVHAARWRAVLALPTDALCERLVSPDEAMRALRQSSPFAGALDARKRWAIRRSVTG